MNDGEQAFELVRSYAAIGHHRTVSATGEQTLHWLARQLEMFGAEVSFQSFEYQHFDCETNIHGVDLAVDLMALYYAFSGHHDLSNLATGRVDAHAAEAAISTKIDALVSQAKTNGNDGLVLGTDCPTGTLCAINREYGSGYDFPVLLTSPHDLNLFNKPSVSLSCFASVRPGSARNVTAHFCGPDHAPTIVVTTPFSVWFQCAGERGSGIAIALHVAKRLSSRFNVRLLLANGHELGFLGGYEFARTFTEDPDCVLHLGSCIANFDGQLTSICSAGPARTQEIRQHLKPLFTRPIAPANPANADDWVGESMCWAPRKRPMLSIAGQAPHFHTKGDLPEVVTSPRQLEIAIDAIERAALALGD